jgi:hypothetical protein
VYSLLNFLACASCVDGEMRSHKAKGDTLLYRRMSLSCLYVWPGYRGCPNVYLTYIVVTIHTYVQTGSGAHQGARGSFPGGKAAGA